MKRTLFSILLLAAATAVSAQQPVIVSIRGGINNTTSSLKNESYLGNGYNVGADVFVPFYRKGWDGSVKGSGFSLGIIASGDYSSADNVLPDNDAAIADKYKVFGGTTEVTSQPEAKSSGSFSGMGGLQGVFSFGKLNIAPSLNAGYLQLKQKGFVQTGSATIGEQDYETALVTSEAQNTNGFVLMPQVKVGYNITPLLSIFVSPSYIMGPEVKHTTQHLVPQGGFNDRNTYELKQFASGTWEDGNTTTSKLNLTRINFGVSFSLGRKTQSSSMPSRLSMTPTTAKQSQGKTFGEKVASGMQSGANAIVVSVEIPFTGKSISLQNFTVTVDGNGTKLNDGTPIVSSKTVKGKIAPRQPGAASASYARIRITQPETGDNGTATTDEYGNFEIKLAHDTLHHVYINDEEFGKIKIIEATAGYGDRITPALTGGVIPGMGVVSAFVAGSPIGGIVVKGGKNPGGNLMTATTNEKGEFELDGLEVGEYKFTLILPDAPQGKSINEKGVKRAEAVDHNTTRNNRERGQLVANPSSSDTESKVSQRAEAKDFNTTRSNREGSGTHQLKAQNNNTIRSGREESEKKIKLKEVDDDTPLDAETKLVYQNDKLYVFTGSDADIQSIGNNSVIECDCGGNFKITIRVFDGSGTNACREACIKYLRNKEKRHGFYDGTQTDNPQKQEVQDFNSSRSNKDRRQLAARPGSPIGGIVVKGGKNPGGNMINLSVGEDGTIQFEVLEAGDYKFIIQTPEATNNTKTPEKK